MMQTAAQKLQGTNERIDLTRLLNRATKMHAQAYDRGDSANTKFWADEMATYSRLLDKLAD